MKTLTREVAAKPNYTFQKEKVDVTEWGDIDPDTGKPEPTCVFVREISAAERDKYEASLYTHKRNKREFNPMDARTKAMVLACCDEHGNAIFGPEDTEWLRQKPVSVIERIFEVFQRLNRFTNEDEEELRKN